MKRHDSMRGYFAYSLFEEMGKNKDIWLLVGDLGYRVFDAHFEKYPERCINTGAAEQALIDIAIGLALEGKIPVCYSITPFLLYRPFESLRTYVNHEKIPIKLVGSGRDSDYHIDGFSHFAGDDKDVMHLLPNIKAWWPEDKEMMPKAVNDMLTNGKPVYLNLRR